MIMKNLLLSCMALSLCQTGFSQIVGNAAYLPGVYVNVGVAGEGGFEGADTVSYPASGIVPGLHPHSNTNYLGFVANPQMDGWVNYDGDFFSPGTPENGWGIEIIDAGGTVDITASNNRAYPNDIPGAFTGYTHTGGVHTLTWEGDYDSSVYSLHFTIVYSLADSALSYTTTVSVSNLGEDIDELYYYRNFDPDNNVVYTGLYSTTNTIVSEPSSSTDLAAVKAEQSSPWYSCVTLSAHDSLARASFGGFSNRDASDLWHGIGYINIPDSAYYYEDDAIALSFKTSNLTFGRALHQFSFETIFGGPGIVTHIAETGQEMMGIYPNPTNGILNVRSKEPVQNISVYDIRGALQFQSSKINTIDLSGYASGMYIVKVKTPSHTVIRRIEKQ
jgi:hypothetical protein